MGTLFFRKEARIYNGTKTASSINGSGKTGQLHVKKKKMKLEHFLTPYMEINSKWVNNIKCKTRNYKTLRGKHRQNTR